LERERKAADDRALRIFQLLRRDRLVAHAIELVHKLLHRAFGHVRANFRAGHPSALELRAPKVAVRAVSVALVFTQIQEKTCGWTTAKNTVGQQYCKIVRTGPLDTER